MKKSKQFWYFIIDNDRKIFCNLGLISSDSQWNIRVVEEQEKGRNIGASSSYSEQHAKENEEFYYSKGYKKSFAPPLDAPVDTSADYNLKLPEYAKNSVRNKIVMLLCHSCRATRFAEMNAPYPGQEVLKARSSDFEAKCLFCGHIARDGYNWFR